MHQPSAEALGREGAAVHPQPTLEEFREALENATDAIGMCTPEGVHFYQNRAFTELFGFLGGNRPASVYCDEGAAAEVFRTITGGGTWTGEVAMFDRNRQVRCILLRAYPNRDEQGRVVGLVGVHTDITERKRAEEARRRLHVLERLGVVAGGIAHDFNNLLTGIFGNIEVAKLDLSPEHPALAALEAAHHAMDSARRLTSRLVTFAKGGDPVLEAVDLRELICETVRFNLAGSSTAPRFDIPSDLWPVKADRGQIEEVIANLTLNAREAMPAGGSLHIGARNLAEVREPQAPELHGRHVRLVFRDDGIGIPATIIDRVFEPYFTSKKVGNGLGLAIVHSIVTKHKGYVGVESAPGVGTTFTVFLPADDAPGGRRAAVPARQGDLPAPVFGRILVMDDEEVVREAASRMLRELGCSVETVANGTDAIERYAAAMADARPFDLTIMDLTIPGGMGGREAVRELLRLDPAAKVIVASGYSSDAVMANFRQHGFLGCLPKPFKLQELAETVAGALRTP